MTDPLVIQPAIRPVHGRPCVPGSKSITNRALVLAALADGCSRLEGALFAEDTLLMADALRSLGIAVSGNPADRSFSVQGCNGRLPSSEATLYVGNAGTVARFLTAVVAAGHGTYTVDGSARMRERPIQPLAEALADLGASIECAKAIGHFPLIVHARGLAGGEVTVRGDLSSQFVSGLLLASPHAARSMRIAITGVLVSKSYVDMTVRMMQDWGLSVEVHQQGESTVFSVEAPQRYPARTYAVEPDATAASYFLAAAALTGGDVEIHGLGAASLQGDVRFAEILSAMGAYVTITESATRVRGSDSLRGVDVDMNDISDTVMTLAAIAPFAATPTRIRNVAHIRYKETDRIAALATELRQLGVMVEEHDDGLTIYPSDPHGGMVHTYDDHRMAMSLALVGLRVPGVRIENPECVRKTFPDYFAELERLTATGA